MDYSTYIQEYLEEKYRAKLVKTKEEVIKLVVKLKNMLVLNMCWLLK